MTSGRPRAPEGGWRPSPLDFSVERFFRFGALDVVPIGASKEVVRRAVPEPLSWALTWDGTESDLWSYGRLDLVFTDDRLTSVYCDTLKRFGDETAAEHHIVVDPWFLVNTSLSRSRVRDRLVAEGLPIHSWALRDEPAAGGPTPGGRDLTIAASGVTLRFERASPTREVLTAFWLEAAILGRDRSGRSD